MLFLTLSHLLTDRNAFVRGKMLPGQHFKRGQRAALRRSLLCAHDQSTELRTVWTGRISRQTPTLRHGEHMKHVWVLDFTLPHLTSTAMQRRCQSKNAAKPQRGANCQIHWSIRTLRDSVRRQTRWTDTQPYEDYEDGPCQGSRLNTSTLVELILALHLPQFYTLTLICCWSGWKINLYIYIVIIT